MAERHFFDAGAVWGLESLILGAPTIVVTSGDSVLAGTASRPSLSWVSGSAGGEISFDIQQPTLTREVVAAERSRRIDEVTTSSVRVPGLDVVGPYVGVIEALPSANSVPAFVDALSGPDGALWLRLYTPPASSEQTWVRFGKDGSAQARVDLPERVDVLAATATLLVTRELDDLDVALVTVWALG